MPNETVSTQAAKGTTLLLGAIEDPGVMGGVATALSMAFPALAPVFGLVVAHGIPAVAGYLDTVTGPTFTVAQAHEACLKMKTPSAPIDTASVLAGGAG